MSLKSKIAKLDEIYSKVIRLRDIDKFGLCRCFTCHKKGNWKIMHNGHFISRANKSTMFFELNTHVQCFNCNVTLRGNLEVYEYRLVQKYGQEKIDELKRMKYEAKKFYEYEIDEMIQYYSDELKRLLKEKI
jgi:hypothetical protein